MKADATPLLKALEARRTASVKIPKPEDIKQEPVEQSPAQDVSEPVFVMTQESHA